VNKMNKFNLATSVATAAMVLSAFVPSTFAATNVTVGGNGAFSYNGVTVKSVKKTVTMQSNTTVANTLVGANTSTGGNYSSFNTGGGNSVTSGAATTNVGVGVGGSSNMTTPSLCGCDLLNHDTNVTIAGNGAFLVNGVVVKNVNATVVSQNNTTLANTSFFTNTTTGGNNSSFNTGGGTGVSAGPATTNVGVVVTGSQNSQ
jgi:hypothetical protein